MKAYTWKIVAERGGAASGAAWKRAGFRVSNGAVGASREMERDGAAGGHYIPSEPESTLFNGYPFKGHYTEHNPLQNASSGSYQKKTPHNEELAMQTVAAYYKNS